MVGKQHPLSAADNGTRTVPHGAKGDQFAVLIEAKKLADKLGGVDKALDALAELL